MDGLRPLGGYFDKLLKNTHRLAKIADGITPFRFI